MSSAGVDYAGKKVIVGLTGRVASCVAALLLKKQGMHVIGVSIITNSIDSDKSADQFPKCHIEDLESVKKFCDNLKIPFYATDAKSQFDSEVIDPLVSSKLSARANTSCFSCSRMRVKILYEKMKLLNADYIATGHFCKIRQNINSSEYFVHTNNDHKSDQSFLLAGIDEKYLKHLLLPLGELKNSEVETIAHKFNLGAKASKDSQEFCFQTLASYYDLAMARVPKSMIKEGQIQNVDMDVFYGDHEGILNHYITERNIEVKGSNSPDKNIEVVGYDFVAGVINVGSKKNLTFKGFQLVNLKFNRGLDKTKPMQCFLKFKYSSEYISCNLYLKNNNSALIEAQEAIYPIVLGESFVIFDRNIRNAKVVGVGEVGNTGDFKLIDRVIDYRDVVDDDQVGVGQSKIFKF
jgi:tRNA-uridine 2-sulfurtransferase